MGKASTAPNGLLEGKLEDEDAGFVRDDELPPIDRVPNQNALAHDLARGLSCLLSHCIDVGQIAALFIAGDLLLPVLDVEKV